MRYEYYQSEKNSKWYWRLIADNNKDIIADGGQGYREVDDCLHGIDLVKKSADAKVIKTDD